MRMWMIDPKLLCRKHLLGEHGEIHKHKHNFEKKHNMTGRIGQIFPSKMKSRHDKLVKEMRRRGYSHESPYEMPDISYLPKFPKPNISLNLKDLHNRCGECKSLYSERG